MAEREFFITGITADGRRFRPSDWVERLTGLGAQFGPDARLRYAADLHPAIHQGQRAVRVLASLEQRAPQLWAAVFKFALGHGLQITPYCDDTALPPEPALVFPPVEG